MEVTLVQGEARGAYKEGEEGLSMNEQLEDIMERYPQSKFSFKDDKLIYRQQFEY